MSTYRVVFSGKATPGFDQDTAIQNLAKLLKRTPEQAAAAFAGKELVLKKGVAAAEAEKLCQTLERAGLMVHSEPEAAVAAPAAPIAPKVPVTLAIIREEDDKAEEEKVIPPMTCPACGFAQPTADICGRCGVVIAKFLQRQAAKAAEAKRAEEEAANAAASTAAEAAAGKNKGGIGGLVRGLFGGKRDDNPA